MLQVGLTGQRMLDFNQPDAGMRLMTSVMFLAEK